MSQPSKKRLKVLVACDTCRTRKIKCDGVRPVCNHCAKRPHGLVCKYTDKRLKEASLPHQGPADSERVSSSDLASLPPQQPTTTSPSHSSWLTNAALHSSVAEEPPVHEKGTLADVDSMNGIVGEPLYSPEVFGSSSAGEFMRQIKAGIDARLGLVQSTAPISQPPYPLPSLVAHRDRTNYGEDSRHFTLPPRGLADRLMLAYWDANWALYPLVNRFEIEADYKAVWSGGDMHYNEYTTMCILNTCFALGCQYSDAVPAEQRRRAGAEYFTRARHLHIKSADQVSVEAVQCLLLMGSYLQTTSEVHECWMMVGKAIRIAQSIGLHQPRYWDHQHSIRRREYARRAWYGCVFMDRVLSMTFGRPGMTPEWLSNAVPLPAMIDDEYLDTQKEGSVNRPDGKPCVMAFAVKALQLYGIMNDILLTLYMRDEEQKRSTRELARILELDEQLQSWHDSIPSFLYMPSDSQLSIIFQRQALILRIRYLHIRILLLRPILARPWHQSTPRRAASSDDSLGKIMLDQGSLICFQAAHELINIFKTSPDLESLSGTLPGWWYSILYLYTAATVVLAEKLKNHGSEAESSPSNLQESSSWVSVISILRRYGKVGDIAKRCVAALEILAAKISPGAAVTNYQSTDERGHEEDMSLINPQCGLDANWESILSTFDVDDMTWLGSMSADLY